MRKEIIGLILVAMLCAACAASAIAQTTPLVISGYIFNPDGSPCNGPDVRITHLNTSVNWNAVVNQTSNYYRLVLDSNNVSTGNVLRFNISGCSQLKTIEYNITSSDIENGGITGFNVTFMPGETTIMVLDTPFLISGYIFNTTDSPCNGPDVHITNLNTSMNRTAETQNTSNYYRLLLNNSSVSTGNILRFNISGCSQLKTIEYNITSSDIENGGLTSFNFTFASNGINISGYKINDTNGNGLWNPGEQGIHGWNITLKNATGAVIFTASTNPHGYYEFTNLLPGSYNVSEEGKAGWMHTNASFKPVTLVDKDLTNLNFTNKLLTHAVPVLHYPFLISGYIFNTTDSPCNGSDVCITNLNTSVGWIAKTNLTSNYYRLLLNSSSVSTGDILRFNISGCSQSKTIEYNITRSDIENGGITSNVTFVPNRINISGYKINDANGNGLWNLGEQGIQGWNITLKNTTGAVISTASTDPQGYYEFTNLLPESYNVGEEYKAGWMHTNASFKLVTLADKDLANLNFTNRLVTITVTELDTPFMISGWTHYKDGTEYNNPVISITNLDTGDNWHPVTRPGYNYYRLILDTTNISSGNVLQFNITDNGNINLTDHTITPDDIICRGLSSLNITIEKGPQPDIIVSDIRVHPLDNSVNATIENIGMWDITGQFNVSFGVNGTTIERKAIQRLNAGSNATVVFEWLLPQAGEYRICINADADDEILELNESNNEYMTDVTIPMIKVIVAIEVDETTHIKEIFLPKNAGSTALNVTEKACDALDILFNYDGEDVTIDGLVNPALYLYNRSSNNWSSIALDRHLDDNNIIGWCDAGKFPATQPDLILSNIRVTSYGSVPHPNITNRIEVTIKNIGIFDVSNFTCVLKADHETVDVVEVERLNAMHNVTVSFKWMPDRTGDYVLSAKVDPDDGIQELNETNNCITRGVTVIPVPTIHVPIDCPTIQDAIDSAPPGSTIHIADGEYISYQLDFPVHIKDKHHLTIIGSPDARIVHRTGFQNPPGLDVIRILNSSNIELRGFTVETRYKTHPDRTPDNVRIIAVKDSSNILISDMMLIHGGDHSDVRNFAIKIENSEYCTITDNFMSGMVGKFYPGMTGIYVGSGNNTICNNTICQFITCIALHGDDNTVYANNLFTGGAGILAVDSGHNHWNSTVPISYTYNNTTFVNRIGNYWHGFTGNDSNWDGIADSPYTSGMITDHYPLIEPHELTFDIVTTGIIRPSRIYAGRNNMVLVTIERKGTYPVPEPLKINLTANNVTIAAKTITIGGGQKTTIRFSWVPESVGSYNLKVDVQPDTGMVEVDTINNVLTTNVEILSPEFNYLDNVSSALDYLNGSQFSTGSISGVSNPARAALSIIAGGEDPATGRWKPDNKSLIEYIRNSPKVSILGMPSWTYPNGLDNLDDFAWTILVISAIGEDPADFGGVNYLVMLRSYYDGRQFQDPDIVEDDALAILALIACGEKNSEMVSNATDYIKTKQNENGGWSSSSGNNDVKVTSLVIQALVAAGDEDSQVIDKALVFLKNMQEDDGGFSDDGFSNVITTSYAVIAITAAGEDPVSYVNNNNKNPIDYLLNLQQDDGSFNQTMNRSMYPPEITTFPIHALVGVPHPVMVKTLREKPTLTDISLSQIAIEDEVYVNTTYTVSTKIRNNGGVFDVMLSLNGTLVNNQTVRSAWSDSRTPITFRWKPESTGTYNLMIAADTDNRINERYENNNRITRQVNVVLPDLYPGAIILPPEVYVNATNTVTVSIRGRTDESFNVTLKADGENLNEWMMEGINDFVELSSDWRPAYIGNHSLELIVDDGDKVMESIETNNHLARKVNVIFPDLVPIAITPCPVYVNATNLITVSIKGTAEGFDLSLTENGTEVGRTSNITCYGSLNVTVPWRPARLGNCTLQASIDPDNNITETNETNNNITRRFEVVLPDIVPVKITPNVIFLNETNKVIITINGTAEGFNATLFANETCIGTGVDLNTYNGTIEFNWTPAHPGKYNLTVLLDPDNAIDETNETNNNLSTVITAAKRIDLKLLDPRGGEILTGMQNITWNATYGEPLSIDLLYSANRGYTWHFIEENTTNSGCYEWNTKDVLDGKYIIKVIARWGDVTQEDWSDRLFIYNKNSATEWGEFHNNGGFSLSNAPDTNERAWTSQDIGAEGSSSLIVADGKVFVYCAGWQGMYSDYTYLVALNEPDGKVLWGTRIGPRIYGSWATPTYNNGKIYVSSHKSVYCIDATKDYTGPILWEFTFPDGGGSVNGGPVVADGKVYVGSWDGGNYYCLDAKSGAEIWKFKINGNSQSTPAVAYGRVFFGDFDYFDLSNSGINGRAYAVDMDDDDGDGYTYEFWNTTASCICGSFTVSDGIVYFSTIDYTFYALDAGNGTQIWRSQVQYTDSTPALYTPSSSSRSYVYVASGYLTNRMYCFNAKNGETIWTVDGLGYWTNSPAVSNDGKVFVGKSGGGGGLIGSYAGLYCLDAFTGEEIWHSDSGGGSPAIANGRVYTTAGYRVIAFGSRSGTRPDLIVENITVPDKLCVGKTINVTAVINNTGTSDVNESFIVELTYAPENEILVIGTISFDSLEMNNATNISFKWTPPAAGDYRLTVTVNAGSTVNEDEMNNMKSLDVVVAEGYPDLIVTRIAAPYVSHCGQVINITVDIENTGIDLTGPFDVGLSINGKPEENKTISLDNQRANVTFNWTTGTDGSYILKATADVNKVIYEFDETNNIMEKKIEVLTNKTFFGYGPGSGGGTGGGSGGGIGSGHGTGGSGESGAGGMEYSGDSSSSVKERMSDITGFLFGDASSGSSGGGGVLPVAFILCLVLILGLLYHGQRREKRSLIDAKRYLKPPGTYRRKNG